MIEFEITNEEINEEIQKVVEWLYRMEEAAVPVFNELFPNLDYVKDFVQNDNISDIEFLFDVVKNAAREKGYEKYDALYTLIVLNFAVLADEDFRKDTFEIFRSLDKDKYEEFLRWVEKQGLSNEEIQNHGFQADAIWSFFSDTMFREH